jgi:perosamine synthetase
MMMPRFIPPAGAPIRFSQILRALRISIGAQSGKGNGLAQMKNWLGVRYIFGISSGRAGLWLVLKALHKLRPERSVVVLPAYTCFTVAAAIVRAGLKLYPIDINPETLDFEFAELSKVPREELLCILTSNLFGLVNDLSRTCEVARSIGVFVVDDAAQALGATRNGYSAGTSADVGFYSLGRGKAITTIEGGVIVTNCLEIASAIQAEVVGLSATSSVHTVSLFIQMLGFSALLDPRLYWIPNSLPYLKLGMTEFDPNFRAARASFLLDALLWQVFEGIGDVGQVRRENAAVLAEAFATDQNFSTPRPAPNSRPSYIRFPLVARDESLRDRALARLREAGIGASAFYPSAICDIPAISKHMALNDFHRPKAEDLSRKILTLPTHHFVRPKDLKRMIEILKGL